MMRNVHAERVLVLAPWGRDAQVIAQVIERQGLKVQICDNLPDLAKALEIGAGLSFITEEILQSPELQSVLDWLDAQPAWSDFPLLVLATKRGGARPAQALETLARLGNVVLLERPLHAETLLSAANSALRARRRQYEIRRHLEAQEHAAIETSRLFDAERSAREESFNATEKLTFALDSAELGTFHCPLPLEGVVWNATCRVHFGLPHDSPGTVPLDRLLDIVHADDRRRFRDSMFDAIAHRSPFDVECRTVAPDGSERWIRAKGVACGQTGGEPTRLDGITIDISAQKAVEVQRETLLEIERKARLDAEHASRMKDEFLATLSHELRTPLSAIIGWTQVLRRQPLCAPEILRAVDTIDRNARTQAKLIEDLLDMSRIISGQIRLDLEPLHFETVIDAVLASLEPGAQAKRLSIEVQREPECNVNGDPSRLQQVVWNLLSNAIKFTPAGGHVGVRLRHLGAQIELTVEDDGIGIPADFLPFVFERFRQNDASSTRSHGGLGLGLAIVKNLVELHGGSAQVASAGLGQGARFSIRLPVAELAVDQLSPACTPWARAHHTATGSSQSQRSRPDLSNHRILVVDDEPDLRELLQQALEDCGACVVAVTSAAEALSHLRTARPHLMISDIGMPGLDGYQLLREMHRRGTEVPAMALTAFAGPEDRARALAAGYRAHVAKPVDLDELLAKVEQELRSTAAA